ncbi:MAG TPA: NADPH-dependent FMN reductase [Longimicrobium sp.]|nr:NADPH-dependent FMN reductase [Longimicrobium sp.]
MKIVGIAGSIRAGSHNRALLRAAAELAPDEVTVEPWDRVREVPLYDGDIDNDGARPEPVEALKRAIAGADAVLIASPEYCYGIPGVLKNAIDWVSRPGYKSVLVNKPVAIVGASGSTVGTARGQIHLRDVMFSCLALNFPHAGVLVAQAGGKFEDGRLTDEPTREFLAAYLRQFAEFVATRNVRPGP